jgi:adenylate cyclase
MEKLTAGEISGMASPIREATDRCGSCGNDLRAKSRFCDVCGSPVSQRPPTAEHKQVTVLFADVVGSLKLAAAVDAERLQEIMNELFNRASVAVQRYQGTVDKFTGDGLMALFGAPAALEDHALRACISALEIQAVARQLATEVRRRDNVILQVRVGLNSGDVIVGEIGSGPGRYTAVGQPVGMAQRMEAAAPAGGVLCSLSTARLVEDATRLGPVEDVAIKGAEAPIPARQVLAVGSDRIVVGRNEGLMLGRDAELNRLRTVFDAGRGHLIGIVGVPGVGKSRLLSEFTRIVADEADVVVARCEAHTTSLAFRALSRVLRALFKVDGLTDAEARENTAKQCKGMLTPQSADAQILFEAMGIADGDAPPLHVSVDGRRRRLVEMMAQAVHVRSVRTVFVLEDAHWIDAPSDDVLAGLGATLSGSTSMFVMTYRPEFHGALHHQLDETVALQPLSNAVAVRLAGQLLGRNSSLKGLADQISVAAVGNPFFVEEIVRDLAERGVLSGSRGSYRLIGDVAEIAVPATVQAVLAARIDRLSTEAKAILNAAAVIGSRFDVETLEVLLPEGGSVRLAELVSAELIDQTEFVPRQRYYFRHPLVRTVAYESQLSATRAQAHRKLAAAIHARDPEAADENAALIATHLEAAGGLAEAYRWHMRAAEWLRPRDLPAARAQWESARRIADRSPDNHDDAIAIRIAPRTMLISTVLFTGISADTDERYRELRELTTQTGDVKSLAIATAGLSFSFAVNDNRVPEAVALASELEDMVSRIDGIAEPRSIILNALAFVRFANCEFDAALAAIEAIHALPGGAPAVELISANALLGAIETCAGRCAQGRRHLREEIEHARALPSVRYALILMYLGVATALGLEQPDEMVDDVREALRRAESFGDIAGIITAQWACGTVLLRVDNVAHEDAIDLLRSAHANMRKHNQLTFALPAIAADLANDAARHGRIDDAVDELRATFASHLAGGSRVLVGCAGEALVGLLIERGSTDDLSEARRILDQWLAQRPGIAALDLWWLKSRVLLADAQHNSREYDELARRYLELCEKLDARGRLAQAHRMVG